MNAIDPSMKSALIQRIHGTPTKFAIVVTGGGSLAISDLLTEPGASHTVLEATVPYAADALTAYVGATPTQACCEAAARTMAMAAYQRAVSLATSDDAANIVGLSCTASLATNREKAGEHRCHVGMQSLEKTRVVAWVLNKGLRNRTQEESLVRTVILNEIAAACELPDRVEIETTSNETAVVVEQTADASWQQLLKRESTAVFISDSPSPDSREDRLIFPGAFSPLHKGHTGMATVAAELRGKHVDYELSVSNVDKSPLDYIEIATRVSQFKGEASVWLTNAPTFVEKARLFPSATFVVGADTITRIADARYYQSSPHRRDGALRRLARANIRFLVFGRSNNAEFQTLSQLKLPPALRELCDEVPESSFRADISSTELRSSSGL